MIENNRHLSVKPIILETIEEGATVSTDQLQSYPLLENSGYEHGRVNHEKEWANGIHHTNNLESFWNIFKNSVRGTHIHISKKHMQRYLNEISFRSNYRARVNLMFDLAIGAL